MSKTIFASKTAWLNILGAALAAAGQQFQIPILSDPQTMIYVIAVANIVNRFFTSKSVTVLPAQPPAA